MTVKIATILVIVAAALFPGRVAAQYKQEFKMSVNPNRETSWGRAAIRFADGVKFRTNGRVQIKVYFEGQLFAGEQTTEFDLLQQGVADFAIGSTINWSPQVKELNLFSLPFMFPNHPALDAVEAGEPGKRIFQLIEQKAVIPIAWGENGFREVTNAKRPIRRPEDFQGLNIRVVGIPIFADIFRSLGANPVSINFTKAQEAFRQGQWMDRRTRSDSSFLTNFGRRTSISRSGATPLIRRSSRSVPRRGSVSVPTIDKSYARSEN